MKEDLNRLLEITERHEVLETSLADPAAVAAAIRMIPALIERGAPYATGAKFGLALYDHFLEIESGCLFVYYPEGDGHRPVAIADTAEKVRLANAILARLAAEEAQDE